MFVIEFFTLIQQVVVVESLKSSNIVVKPHFSGSYTTIKGFVKKSIHQTPISQKWYNFSTREVLKGHMFQM